MLVVSDAAGVDLVAGNLDAGLDRCIGLIRMVLHELDEGRSVLTEGEREEGFVADDLGATARVGEAQRVVPTQGGLHGDDLQHWTYVGGRVLQLPGHVEESKKLHGLDWGEFTFFRSGQARIEFAQRLGVLGLRGFRIVDRLDDCLRLHPADLPRILQGLHVG